MTKLNQPDGQKAIHPSNIFSIISLGTGLFGWVLGIFIMLTSFTPLSNYFHFGQSASVFLLILPAISWLIALRAGRIGIRQNKGTGLAKWGIGLSNIGCVLLYGFFLLVALGFYLVLS